MARLTPDVPYEDLGDRHQIAEFTAAWVMKSSESAIYLALSDFRPVQCGSEVVRRDSFEDIEALAGGLPILPLRSYRICSEQGVIVVEAAVIDRQYRWVVTLEPLAAVEVGELLVVPRKIVEVVGDRSAVLVAERSPRLLIRRQ